MNASATLQRIRLELDRSLRARPFFARAIRGDLDARPYGDLIAELAGLFTAVDRDGARELDELASRDLLELNGGIAPGSRRLCWASGHVRALAGSYAPYLESLDALDLSVALFGASWCLDACGSLSARHPAATAFLEELSRRGPARFLAVMERLRRGAVDGRHASTFAEVASGVILGVATYLDSIWPAPSVTGAFIIPT
jgi:hypothetical protein